MLFTVNAFLILRPFRHFISRYRYIILWYKLPIFANKSMYYGLTGSMKVILYSTKILVLKAVEFSVRGSQISIQYINAAVNMNAQLLQCIVCGPSNPHSRFAAFRLQQHRLSWSNTDKVRLFEWATTGQCSSFPALFR